MKKYYIVFVLFIALFLGGCGKNKEPEKVLMDELDNTGYYHYTNIELGFGVYLPKEFEYYHVQRKVTNNYTDTEFFVPTSDKNYPQEIQSYAKPIIVRIWDKDVWNNAVENGSDTGFIEKGKHGQKIYTIKFWKNIPIDWQDNWKSEGMKKNILDRVEVY